MAVVQAKERTRGVVARARARAAQLVWFVCAACAVLLAAGALLVALEADGGHQVVELALSAADLLDLGLFDRHTGLTPFTGERAEVGHALLNWGCAALVWLLLGRLGDALLRP